MDKEKFTKEELEKLGFAKEQINEIFGRTGGKKTWLAFDVMQKPDILIKNTGCTKDQLDILKNKVLKDYPFDQHYQFSIKMGEKVTVHLG